MSVLWTPQKPVFLERMPLHRDLLVEDDPKKISTKAKQSKVNLCLLVPTKERKGGERTSRRLAMRSWLSGWLSRKRPADSTSAAAASILCPTKSSRSTCRHEQSLEFDLRN